MHRQSGAKRVAIRSGNRFDTVHFIAKTGKREIGGREAHPLAVQEIELLDKEPGGLHRPPSSGARESGLVDSLDMRPDYGAMACLHDTGGNSSRFFPWRKPANVKLLWYNDTSGAIPVIDDDNILDGAGSKRLPLPGMKFDDLNSNGIGRVVQARNERLARPVSFGARDSDFVDNLDKTIWKKPDYDTMACPKDTSVVSPKWDPWKKPTKVELVWRKDANDAAPIIENKGYGKLLCAGYVDVEKQSIIPIGSKFGGSSGYDGDVSESIAEKKSWKKWTVRIGKLCIGIGCIAIIFMAVIIVMEILRAFGLSFNYNLGPFKKAQINPDLLFLLDQAPKSG